MRLIVFVPNIADLAQGHFRVTAKSAALLAASAAMSGKRPDLMCFRPWPPEGSGVCHCARLPLHLCQKACIWTALVRLYVEGRRA